MLLRRLWMVLAFLTVPAVASADAHRAGLFGGYSYLKASSLNGVHVAGDVVLGDLSHPSWYKTVSLVGDFSAHKGTHEGVEDVAIKTLTVGLAKKFAPSDTSKHVGTVHALFGKAFGEGDSVFITTVGGAYDMIWHRDQTTQYGIRLAADGIFPKDGDKFLRISAGFVYRFKY